MSSFFGQSLALCTVFDNRHHTPRKEHYVNGVSSKEQNQHLKCCKAYALQESQTFQKRYYMSPKLNGCKVLSYQIQISEEIYCSAHHTQCRAGEGPILESQDYILSKLYRLYFDLEKHTVPLQKDIKLLKNIRLVHETGSNFRILFTISVIPFSQSLFTRRAIFIFGNCIRLLTLSRTMFRYSKVNS